MITGASLSENSLPSKFVNICRHIWVCHIFWGILSRVGLLKGSRKVIIFGYPYFETHVVGFPLKGARSWLF